MQPSRPRLVEICVTSVEDAIAAQAGGADRIELCADLAVGGITPSAGTISLACERLSIPVNVMIRARGGDFTISPLEYEIMARDIEFAKGCGAGGIVFGVLLPDGSLDEAATEQLVALSVPLPVTFHKAFDLVPDPFKTLERLGALGVERLLTSGGLNATHVAQKSSVERLARMTEEVTRPTLLAGGGIRPEDVPMLRRIPGLVEIHLASGTRDPSTGRQSAPRVADVVGAWKSDR